MLVLLTMVVVDMGTNNEVAQRLEAIRHTLPFRAIGEVSMADIEIEADCGQTSLLYKRAQISGRTHFTGGVFDADSDIGMMGVEREMFKSAERSIALARIGGLA